MRNVSTIQLLLSKYLMLSFRLSAQSPPAFLSACPPFGKMNTRNMCVCAALGHTSLDSMHK